MTEGLDPSRLVSNASGWTDKNVGDVIDRHNYPEPAMYPAEEDRATVLGEFGGLGLPVEGHLWRPDRLFDYRGVADGEALTQGYVELFSGVYALRPRGLAAAVYTQTTDVEGEVNGLLTYDRDVIKVDVARVREANLGLIELPEYEPILETAAQAQEGQAPQWRYTFNEPAQGWQRPGFDDSSWKRGRSGFGTPATPNATVGTRWDGSDVWLRRGVSLTAEQVNDPALRWRIHHDEDVTVSVNGRPVLSLEGFADGYRTHELSAEARDALRAGDNLIAVHCRQTRGGQYVDVGLTRVETVPNPMPREDARAGR